MKNKEEYRNYFKILAHLYLGIGQRDLLQINKGVGSVIKIISKQYYATQ